jgi:hypothetical protein
MAMGRRALTLGLLVAWCGVLGCQTPNDAAPHPEHAGSSAQGSPPAPPTGPVDESNGPHDRIAARDEPCDATIRCGPGLGCSGLFHDAEGRCIPEQAAADRCHDEGGEWGRWGMLGTTYCMRILEDAGQPCAHSGECEGHCIAQGDGSGRCQRHETQFGCYSVLERGEVGRAICVD